MAAKPCASLPGGARLRAVDADGKPAIVLARDVNRDMRLRLVNPYGDAPATVACVVRSSAQHPYVGNMTVKQAIRRSRERRLRPAPFSPEGDGGKWEDDDPDARFDIFIDDAGAFVEADGVPAVAWDPTFVLNASVQRLPGYAEGRIDLMRDASRSSGPPTTRAIDITHKEATELHALLERVAVGGCGVDGADGCNAKALMAFTRHLRHLLLR